MKRLLILGVIGISCVAVTVQAASLPAFAPGDAEQLFTDAMAQADAATAAAGKIPGQYIVVLKDSVGDVDGAVQALARAQGVGILQSYSHALKGFTANLSDAQLSAIMLDPRVAFVSEDRVVQASAKQAAVPAQMTPLGIVRVGAPANANKGAGVGVAVIDTGIDLSHPDLTVASQSKSCISGARNANDDNGHGTHVAGTIAAVDNTRGVIGVAPGAKLFAVKVLDKYGSGSWSSVICGIDWVTANAATLGIKVANMSLGGGGSSDNNCGSANNDALHKAICKSVAAGVVYVVAAGNDGRDTAQAVPAAYDDAVITVTALADTNGAAGGGGAGTSYGADDTFASFSNYGSAVDIGAPGVSIYSTWKGGGYATLSGTSMATPHVAGAAALYKKTNPSATWQQVRDALRAAGEAVGSGHTDPSGKHPEPILRASTL